MSSALGLTLDANTATCPMPTVEHGRFLLNQLAAAALTAAASLLMGSLG